LKWWLIKTRDSTGHGCGEGNTRERAVLRELWIRSIGALLLVAGIDPDNLLNTGQAKRMTAFGAQSGRRLEVKFLVIIHHAPSRFYWVRDLHPIDDGNRSTAADDRP